MTEHRDYLLARIGEALASDPRVGELGLDVVLGEDEVVVTGTVSTPDRREAVSVVVGELVPGVRVRNDTSVPPLDEPQAAQSEHLG